MKGKLFAFTVASILLMTSYVTIFTGTRDALKFDSKPQGAKVYIDGLRFIKPLVQLQ